MKILFWMFIGFDRHATSEHLLTAVIEQLCEAGHSVHILQKDTGGSLPPIPAKLSAYAVTTDVVPFRAVDKGNFIARYLTELKYVNACKKHLTSNYDAVFIQSNTVAGFAVRAVRKRLPNAIVTFNVQDIFPYNAAFSGKVKKNGLLFQALAGVQRYAYNHSDHVITISEDMKETLVSDGVDADKIDVIYNWSYQDEPYDRAQLDFKAVSHMFSHEYFNVVYAGNIGVMQNVELLIEAARRMKGDKTVWFHIIGNGVYKAKLEASAKAYGITNISFWPMQPPELAPVIYSAASVNVIPLVKDVYRSALPSKTATCLACQQPIIFAIGKESGFGQKVEKETGCVLIACDDAGALVHAIGEIKSGARKAAPRRFYLNNCVQSQNSRQYAKQIVKR